MTKKSLIKRIYKKFFQDPNEPWYLNTRKHLKDFEIGDWSYGYLKVSRGEIGTLKIGKFCSIARGTVVLLGGEHRADWVTTYLFQRRVPFNRKAAKYKDYIINKGDVIIGNDVWIGHDSLIMSGVTIGDGAIIGAKSVVRRDMPPYSIVAGNPARPVGYRFDKAIIEELLKIAWWNWPLEKIEESYPLLFSNEVEKFIDKYKSISLS